MNKRNKDNPDRLPVGKFFAWKSRDLSLAALNVMMGFLTIFCTDTLGMPAALVGTLLMASKACDAFTDLFTGWIVDNTKTKWGKARPYEICVLGAWLCTILVFFCSPEWSLVAKSVWVFVMYTFVFSIFTSMLYSNGTPYMIRAFKNRIVIAKVASYGGIISTLGGMIISVSFPILMAKLATSAQGWRTLILMFAVPLAIIGMLRFIFVKEDTSIDDGTVDEKIHFKTILKMLKTNKYAWLFAGVVAMYNIVTGMNAVTYYFKYVVGDIGLMGVFGIFSVILLPVMFIFPTLMKKFSVSNLITMGCGLAVAGYGILFFAGANITLLLIGGILTALAAFPISYLQTIVIMELSTFNEWKGLPRMEGSTGIISGFASNVSIGLGAGLLGILLGAAGYNGTLTVQPDSTMTMIRLLYSLIPLILMVIIIICAFGLGKLEKRIPQMEKDISDRKAALKEGLSKE